MDVQVRLCEEKLERATKLMAGLGGEKARWNSKVEELRQLYLRLIGTSCVTCWFAARMCRAAHYMGCHAVG